MTTPISIEELRPMEKSLGRFAFQDIAIMGRLRTLAPRIGALAARLPVQDVYQDRDRVQHWRAWYKTARWQRLRWSVLVRDLFTCKMCKRVESQTSQLVADHKTPHRGDRDLFWDETNLQCLCKTCHDSTKQRQERQSHR